MVDPKHEPGFEPKHNYPEHQGKIKINGWALMHIEFMLDKFLKHVPLLCKEIDIFYDNLTPEQQLREKLLHIKHCCNKTKVHRKLF